jgi:protein-disulfide isomerase
MVGIGIATSVALAGISLGILGTYCLVCLATYGVTFAQGAALFASRRDVPTPFRLSGITNAGGTAALVVAIVIAGFQFLKPSLVDKQATVSPTTLPTQALADKAVDIPLSKSAYAGLGEDYRKGGDNATVVIQEFADFQCPGCARMAEVLTNLQKEYGDKILLVYRTYPLDSGCNSAVQGRMHDYACKAAVMARCAGQFGKFWAYHDTLYTNQQDINETNLKQWARDMGMPADQIESCWASKDLEAKIKDDIELAGRIGVDSTPTLFINGRKVVGPRDIDSLRAQIDNLLQP